MLSVKVMCYEPLTGQHFMTELNDIKNISSRINEIIVKNGHATLADWLDILGLNAGQFSENLVITGPVDVAFDAQNYGAISVALNKDFRYWDS